jgi:riboflavin biosynthesis pyrimidine reductase
VPSVAELAPLETLFDARNGQELPLPPLLAALYGSLHVPHTAGRAHVIGNFVSSLDGVVALSLSDQTGGGDISAFNTQDQMVMGLLRAVADAIVVGAGTLRAGPKHIWTAEVICGSLADHYAELRRQLGKPAAPLNVFVTAHGSIDMTLPVFTSGKVPVLVVTTAEGEPRLRTAGVPDSVQVRAAGAGGALSAGEVLQTVLAVQPADVVLVEGGPRLMAGFFAGKCLDELFLTLAPQVAGRAPGDDRLGFVAGRHFLPDDPRWARLSSVKRGGSYLFLRYSFPSA